MAFNVKQIYTTVNEIAKQVWGDKAIAAVDLSGIIAMGDKVLSSQDDKELFMNTLINRIGKTIISNRPYSGIARNIVRDTMEYGSIVQKIYVAPFEATENTSWSKIAKGDNIEFGAITPPEAQQYLFESRDVYQFIVTIPDYQINTAFTSAESLGAFISAIYTSMQTTIELSLDNMVNLCIDNFIGEKLLYEQSLGHKGIHAVNLLDNYNKAMNTNLDEESALKSQEFLRYAGQQIKIYIKRMQTLSTLFNTKQLKRHTPKEDLQIFLLTDYASANATYLESDTFHKELVELPGYTEIPYWQSQGEKATFADVSSINIKTSTNGTAINKKYIIGFMFDREALGVMYNRRESKAFYSPYQEVTQKYEKLDMGYFNDLSENGIVFYLEKING